jgi:membrane associated rhomboid family serine protease
MTPTPVGMRCPECSKERTRVTSGPAAFDRAGRAPATFVLIGINVFFFLAEIAAGAGGLNGSGSSIINSLGLRGSSVAGGEWYRLVTGGFLHAGLIHLLFNMFALYILGRLLEPAIGTPRFLALYFASLFAGAFGALALTDPGQVTVGASGAIFGIFGAAFVIARGRGMNTIASEIGFILVLNLALTFGIRGISIGGHLGGLLGGLICALVIVAGDRGMLGPNRFAAEMTAMAVVGIVSIAGALAVA